MTTKTTTPSSSSSTTLKTQCVACGKEKSVIRCEGCLEPFCYNHFGEHRKEFSAQLEEIDSTCDLFHQTITKLTTKPQRHPLFQYIDQWEANSIAKIQQAAEEARKTILKHFPIHVSAAGEHLKDFIKKVRVSRQDNDFFETDIQRWKEELEVLREKLRKPSNIIIEITDIPLVTKLSVDVFTPIYMLDVDPNAKWVQNGMTVAGNSKKGNGLNQLNTPTGLYLDGDHTIYITDQVNHRIMAWTQGSANGEVVAGGKKQGNRLDQLNNPVDITVDKENDFLIISDAGNRRVLRWPLQNGTQGQTIISDINCYGVALDSTGYLYVSDPSKHEVRQWSVGDTGGIVVAGGNGEGDQLNQLATPTFIFVDHQQSLYVSDYTNHRVVKWIKGAKEGIVIAGGQGQGDSLNQLSFPCGVVVDRLGTVYIADYGNKRIMRWLKGADKGSVIVNELPSENNSNQLSNPTALSLDQWGNLYVTNGHRVQRFNIV